jgi:uncharacterized protein YgbK (DUF1537 family)
VQLVILADDFTGACDAAGAFASLRSTFVSLGTELVADEVVAIDLDLRERDDAEARATSEAAARRVRSDRPEARVLLKIDSTLRGPIGGLVDGALVGAQKEIAVIAPAFPEQGRLLHEGCLQVDGRRGPSLTNILGMQYTALLGANFARSSQEVEQAVEHARMRGARRVVVDADAPDCLMSVAQAWPRHPEWLLVGSAGLARQVAGAQPSATTDLPSIQSGPLLVIAGSPTPTTRAQLERLAAGGPAGVVVMSTPPVDVRDAGEAAQTIADAVATWSTTVRPGAVILVGGATARAVCERLNAHGVRLIGELSPGIPCGYFVGGRWDHIPIITKAGGFGSPDALLDVAQALGVSSTAQGTHD